MVCKKRSCRNKIILSTGALHFLPLKNIFFVAHEAEFDGLEIIIDDNEETDNVKKIKNYILKYDLPVLSVHMPFGKCNRLGNGIDEVVSRTIEVAKAIKSQVAVFHPTRDGIESLLDNIDSLAKTNKLKIVIENLPRNEKYSHNRLLYDPLLLAKKAKNICLDTSHLATTGLNFKKKTLTVIDQIKHVHLSDSRLTKQNTNYFSDDHLPVGLGKLNIKWLLCVLRQTGYRGIYCLEMRPKIFETLSSDKIIVQLSLILRRLKKLM